MLVSKWVDSQLYIVDDVPHNPIYPVLIAGTYWLVINFEGCALYMSMING